MFSEFVSTFLTKFEISIFLKFWLNGERLSALFAVSTVPSASASSYINIGSFGSKARALFISTIAASGLLDLFKFFALLKLISACQYL